MSHHTEQPYSHLPGEVVNLALKVSHRRQDYELLAAYLRSAAPAVQSFTLAQASRIEVKAGNCFLVRCSEHEVVELVTNNKRLKKFYWTANGTRRLLKRELAPESRVTMVYIIQKVRDLVSKRCIALPDSDLWLVMYLPPRSVPIPECASAAAAAATSSTATCSLSTAPRRHLPLSKPAASSASALFNSRRNAAQSAFHSLTGISSPFYADEAAQPFPLINHEHHHYLHLANNSGAADRKPRTTPQPRAQHSTLPASMAMLDDDAPVFRRAMPKRRRADSAGSAPVEQEPLDELSEAEQHRATRARSSSSRDGVISPVPEAMAVGVDSEQLHPLNPLHPYHPLESGLGMFDPLDQTWIQPPNGELLMDLSHPLLSSAHTHQLPALDLLSLGSVSAESAQSSSTTRTCASVTPEHLLTPYTDVSFAQQAGLPASSARFPSSSSELAPFSSSLGVKPNMLQHWCLDSVEGKHTGSASGAGGTLASLELGKSGGSAFAAPFAPTSQEPRSDLQANNHQELGQHVLFPRGYFASPSLLLKPTSELGESPLFAI
jgi:hypothetical protein